MVNASHDSDSDAESFHSFDDGEPQPPSSETTKQKPTPAKPLTEKFPPEEEASLLAESNSIKGAANTLFGSGSYENAIQSYDRALASCPNYLDYELAVLRSNVAACHLKLQEWKATIESATKGVDCLERLEPLPDVRAKKDGKDGPGEIEEDGVEEVDDGMEERIENLRQSGRTLDQVRKLQIKLLTRRAKARVETNGWSSLQGADEDYRILLSPTMLPIMSATDRRQVEAAARALGPKLNAAKDKEMAEMMGNLKGIGNSLLKPFGLSTNNFQFIKDEKTGGYSMNFDQNAKSDG